MKLTSALLKIELGTTPAQERLAGQKPRPNSPVLREVLCLIFIVSGFAGLIYESIWTHDLKLILGQMAFAQIMMLTFVGGIAIDAALSAHRTAHLTHLFRLECAG